ncbi:MAG: hypothetical protein K2X38_22390 [Gemmataceae bacterium]|nr:hypothetical protein [Gemmataceae bacterium]
MTNAIWLWALLGMSGCQQDADYGAIDAAIKSDLEDQRAEGAELLLKLAARGAAFGELNRRLVYCISSEDYYLQTYSMEILKLRIADARNDPATFAPRLVSMLQYPDSRSKQAFDVLLLFERGAASSLAKCLRHPSSRFHESQMIKLAAKLGESASIAAEPLEELAKSKREEFEKVAVASALISVSPRNKFANDFLTLVCKTNGTGLSIAAAEALLKSSANAEVGARRLARTLDDDATSNVVALEIVLKVWESRAVIPEDVFPILSKICRDDSRSPELAIAAASCALRARSGDRSFREAIHRHEVTARQFANGTVTQKEMNKWLVNNGLIR